MEQQGRELETYLESFTAFLQERNKEASTIKMYAAEVCRFLKWIRACGKDLSHVYPDDIVTACHQAHGEGTKEATINKSISILSSFFKWAKERGVVAVNPAEHIRLPEQKKTDPPRWLSETEEARLLQYAAKERNPFKKTRNEALIYVMLYAGLRVDEVSQLRLESLRDHTLIVYDDDAESRRVPIDETTRQKLREWTARRSEANKPDYAGSPFLFVTERSARMQPRAIQFVIESFSERLGFPVLCQHLRHTYCRRLVERGVPVERIKDCAGHKSILTTWRYYAGMK